MGESREYPIVLADASRDANNGKSPKGGKSGSGMYSGGMSPPKEPEEPIKLKTRKYTPPKDQSREVIDVNPHTGKVESFVTIAEDEAEKNKHRVSEDEVANA